MWLHGNLVWLNPPVQELYHYFTGKVMQLPINPWKFQNFSTSNDLQYMVHTAVVLVFTKRQLHFKLLILYIQVHITIIFQTYIIFVQLSTQNVSRVKLWHINTANHGIFWQTCTHKDWGTYDWIYQIFTCQTFVLYYGIYRYLVDRLNILSNDLHCHHK